MPASLLSHSYPRGVRGQVGGAGSGRGQGALRGVEDVRAVVGQGWVEFTSVLEVERLSGT